MILVGNLRQLMVTSALAAAVAVVIAVGNSSAAAACSPVIDTGGDVISNPTFFDKQCVVGSPTMYPRDGVSFDGSLGFVIPRDNGADALQGVNTKQQLYDKLWYNYNTRGWVQKNWWAKDGAAFVVFRLIGKAPPADRNVTAADWAELQRRLDNPSLTLNNDPNHAMSPNSTSIRIDPNRSAVGSSMDFVGFTNPGSPPGAAVVLKLNGNEVVALETKCANLLGGLSLPAVPQWSTSGSTLVGVDHDPNVSSWTAQPGNTLYWRHGIRNGGPSTTPTINFAIGKTGFSNGWTGNIQPQGSFALSSGQLVEMGYLRGWSSYSVYTVTQADVGNKLCESISWGPWDSSRPAAEWKGSTPACVTIPYNFKLTPTVDAPTNAVESGAPIGPITPAVNNSGPTKGYDNSKWQLSKFVVAPGGAVPGTSDTSTVPCAYYKNGCANIGSGTGTFMPGDTTVGALASYTLDDAPAGSRICFALSVTGYDVPHQPSGNWWRNGVPTCVMVGKKPKLQVWGGDVATRANIDVSLTQKTVGVYGSWVEYGAFSVGTNGRLASGAGLSPVPIQQTSAAQSAWSKLTFANVTAAGGPRYGLYSSAAGFRPLPAIAQYFGAMSNKAGFVGNKPGAAQNTFATGDAVRVMTAGNLTLQGDTIPAGRSVVIVASGTVTITGDITYDNKTLKSLGDLPQLVIIAKNINITSGVHNVDAWLVTSDTKTGVVDTCSDVALPLTAKVCDNQLTIHGPIVAGELHLKRTGGSGTGAADSGTPAEVINLRPDAYLWAQLVASGVGKAETVYTTELPPRF